jgi:hypothetical protein
MRLGIVVPTFVVLCTISPGFSVRPAAVTVSVPLERANPRLLSAEYFPSSIVSVRKEF